jgi:hypothetical protein
MDHSISIERIEGPVRGGAQGFLIQGQDQLFYVAKFMGNPQGNRTLINEWIAGQLLQELKVSTPAIRILTLSDATAKDDRLYFRLGSKKVRIEGRFHFGSQYPVNPTKLMITDLLPGALLSHVINLPEFALMFVFDQWIGQIDTRQAVFVRARGRGSKGFGMRSYFIDNGMCFGGKEWAIRDTIRTGLFIDRKVYNLLNMRAQSESAISCIQNLSAESIYSTQATVPPDWYSEEDDVRLTHLLRSLERRRQTLPLIVERALRALEEDQGLPVK